MWGGMGWLLLESVIQLFQTSKSPHEGCATWWSTKSHLYLYLRHLASAKSLVKISRVFLTTSWNLRIDKVDLVDSMCCLNTCHCLAKPISQWRQCWERQETVGQRVKHNTHFFRISCTLRSTCYILSPTAVFRQSSAVLFLELGLF